jgi:hypothetical protein
MELHAFAAYVYCVFVPIVTAGSFTVHILRTEAGRECSSISPLYRGAYFFLIETNKFLAWEVLTSSSLKIGRLEGGEGGS